MKKRWALIILLILSGLTHFILWGYPAQVVFDEVHFGLFSSQYLEGKYFFDIHPPLAKLLISGMGEIGHVDPNTTFSTIGKPFPDSGYLWLRFLPTLAGTLLPLVIFLLCLEFGLSIPASFSAGLSIILENSLLVQSRFILLDSLLLLFGFTGLLTYFIGRRQDTNRQRYDWFFLTGLLLGAAACVKWTGLAYLGLVGLVELWFLCRPSKGQRSWADSGKRFILLAVVPFIFYFSIFAVHFARLPNSGTGDAFMSPSFQKTLIGSRYASDASIKPEGEWSRFTELNSVMYKANGWIKTIHPYSSQWYTWPFEQRPIYYWESRVPGSSNDARIYLLGNPLIYWLSFAAALFALLCFIFRAPFIRRHPKRWSFLLLAYFANWLPFIFITRQMFLYHYFAALVFSIIILAALIDELPASARWRNEAYLVVGIIFLIFFLWFSPFTYGLPLPPAADKYLFWFSSWR